MIWRNFMFNPLRSFYSVITLLLITVSSQSFAQKAPDFSLNGDKGKIQLSNYKNKVVYVDFWASWCKPCQKSFSFMNDMQSRYGKKGFEIIAINLDSDRPAAKKFLKKNPAKFKIAYDPEGKTPDMYKLKVMPTSYLIDRRGNLVNVHKGFKDNQKNQLEKTIVQALNKK
ncbi:MAG: hypothetical protein DIZ80_14115 [endosymbiont of Galathealinum brachiosum]|uniref:Thioredoxin domain-containing protein n=1 Tax=endosymbiont of Galathealinum brachiosum TaxID=2200906 RepID=A0A370DAN2_9GAMM|nr:MAG: hypothetical protein DIZ80_14115 [endosymbiont of Galathealinum brachiosum]